MFNLCEKLKMNNYAKTQYDHNEITEILNGVNLDELSYEEKFKLIDLKIGHSGENFVIRNTMKKHPECNYKKNNNGDYDIEITLPDGRICLIEVKNDLQADKTGNAAIEFSSRGKPSGIKTTKADIWVHIIGNKSYSFWVEDLKRKLLIENNYDYIRTIRSIVDEESGNEMFIIRNPKFLSWRHEDRVKIKKENYSIYDDGLF